MHAYVINLLRSPQRREHMQTQLAKTGISYEFVVAIDGSTLTLDGNDLIHPSLYSVPWLRPDVIGNALSHLHVYQKMLDEGREHALVLEDDVDLSPGLAAVLDSLPVHLTGAEVALLNYDSFETLKMSRVGMRKLSSGQDLLLPIDASKLHSAAAYVVTQSACKRILANVPPIRARSDDWGDHYKLGYLDRVRCVYPMPVAKNPTFPSTMEHNPHILKSWILGLLSRHDIQALEHLIAYRRKRIWQSQTQVEIVDAPFINKPSKID